MNGSVERRCQRRARCTGQGDYQLTKEIAVRGIRGRRSRISTG
jgi:hypothetical protein